MYLTSPLCYADIPGVMKLRSTQTDRRTDVQAENIMVALAGDLKNTTDKYSDNASHGYPFSSPEINDQ